MAQVVLERLRRKFGDAIIETSENYGNDTAVIVPERLSEVAEFLRDDRELGFDMPIDCTAIDSKNANLVSMSFGVCTRPSVTIGCV